MNDSIKIMSLDIHNTISGDTVNTKRGDTARKLVISLVDGGTPYTIAEDCYAVFTAKKPDGKVVYNDCTINGNTIIYQLTEQTVSVEGRVNSEIKLYGADGKLITSPKFTINVFGTVYNEGDEVESTDEFSALTQMVSDTLAVQKAAGEAAESANTAAVNATAAAENANKATESAVAATVAANNAALSADASSKTANQAAQSATEAAALATEKAAIANNNAQFAGEKALAAEVATSSALQAADEATAAADKAIRASYSCLVVGKVSGENIPLDNASEQYLGGLKIFGKTTQNGTPSPDAPVELVSVGGNGSITVNVTGENDAQSMTVATPNGLPGIPVTTGGSYTDANGQQWICDEVDFERGVYVQRIIKVVFDANNRYVYGSDPTITQFPATNVRFEFRDENATNILRQDTTKQQIILSNYGEAAQKANFDGVWINSSGFFEGRLSVDSSNR